jgi:hypothetical protein
VIGIYEATFFISTVQLTNISHEQFYALATFSQAPAIEESAYIRLLREFCGLVREDKLLQLRLIGLHALEGVVSSELFQQLDFEGQAHLVMPTLLLALMGVGGDPYILHDK